MCEACNHITIYSKAKLVDPTRTGAVRRAFEREMMRRFNEIKKQIKNAIITQDVFGLAPQMNVGVPQSRAFAYPTSSDKIEAFLQWLRELERDNLLTVSTMPQMGAAMNSAWTNMYVADSYKRGLQRARYELKNAGYKVPSIEGTGGVESTFSTPFHMDRVAMMYTRTFSELQGITNSMDTQISRILSESIINGDNPRTMASKLVAVIEGGGEKLGITDSLGRFIPAQRRAQMLARTETIRTFHQATIQEYRNWGILGVEVQAEWSTAGDGRVCLECSGLEGKVYTLDEIQSMIPRHPNCRCLALPKKVEKSTATYQQQVAQIKKATPLYNRLRKSKKRYGTGHR